MKKKEKIHLYATSPLILIPNIYDTIVVILGEMSHLAI